MRDRGDLIWGIMVACTCVASIYGAVESPCTSPYTSNEILDFITDFAAINFHLFSKESLLVFSATAPLYTMAYGTDKRLHRAFYDQTTHTNTFDIGYCRNFLTEDIGIALPLLAIGGGLWLSHNTHNRIIGRTMIAGLSAFNIARIVLKETLTGNYCYRPYSGCFKKKLTRGGFPSGHAGALVYATILLTLHKNASWAIPIGVYSATVISSILVCNYHYLSQIIAGGALGALYAIATSAVINRRIGERFAVKTHVNNHGSLGLTLSYSF